MNLDAYRNIITGILKNEIKGALPQYPDGGPGPKSQPTRGDSLAVYNQALKVLNYYKNNKYTVSDFHIRSDNSDYRRDLIMKRLDDDYDGFKSMPKKVDTNKGTISSKDITYRVPVDDNRFFQRESANFILDLRSPMPLYDRRISPTSYYEYLNEKRGDALKGDRVNIQMYDPIAVKPWDLLTPAERELRIKRYGYPEGADPNTIISQPSVPKQQVLSKPVPPPPRPALPTTIPTVGRTDMSGVGNIPMNTSPSISGINYKTNYAFTYPTFDSNVHNSVYLKNQQDLDDLTSSDRVRMASSRAGQGWGTSTGYVNYKDGGKIKRANNGINIPGPSNNQLIDSDINALANFMGQNGVTEQGTKHINDLLAQREPTTKVTDQGYLQPYLLGFNAIGNFLAGQKIKADQNNYDDAQQFLMQQPEVANYNREFRYGTFNYGGQLRKAALGLLTSPHGVEAPIESSVMPSPSLVPDVNDFTASVVERSADNRLQDMAQEAAALQPLIPAVLPSPTSMRGEVNPTVAKGKTSSLSIAAPDDEKTLIEYSTKAQKFLSAKAPNTDITGEMLAEAAIKAFNKYGKTVPVEIALAQLMQEGYLNSKETSRPRKTKNPYNVGNVDNGNNKYFNSVQDGIDAYYDLMVRKYLSKKSPEELLENFTDEKGRRYASDSKYEKSLKSLIRNHINKTIYKAGGMIYDIDSTQYERLKNMGFDIEIVD